MSWLTIESDPAVFTTLISDLGVKDVVVQELLSIDAASINAIQPLYGIIFLFKYQASQLPAHTPLALDAPLWFAHQIIQNACGTQALLTILLNTPDLDIGTELASFRDFTAHFPADLRGESMTNSDLLRNVHNSFSRAEMYHLESDETGQQEGDAPHHFIAYIVGEGRLYELDGLQQAPIDHGAVQDIGVQVQQVLEARMARYEASEVHFNLLALTRDPLANGGLDLSEEERVWHEEQRAIRAREVEMRRHNFAAAIVELTRLAFRGKSASQVDALIRDGKTRAQQRLQKQHK